MSAAKVLKNVFYIFYSRYIFWPKNTKMGKYFIVLLVFLLYFIVLLVFLPCLFRSQEGGAFTGKNVFSFFIFLKMKFSP